jgi:ATP-binding cassette subfamily C (CFTR/MRP) protein 1
MLKAILPRLALIGFTYAQPFLITAALNFLSMPASKRNVDHAYGLICATALIYLGIAVSLKTSAYTMEY